MSATMTFTKTAAPDWLLAMWKEIDDKTFGSGFDCFAEDAVCNLGVADWHGRESIRSNLRDFIDKGFTARRYLSSYANEMAWRENNRRVSNGGQYLKVAGAALNAPVPRIWSGYWQR